MAPKSQGWYDGKMYSFFIQWHFKVTVYIRNKSLPNFLNNQCN